MKILVIEDDNFFQKFYKKKLEEKGFQVEIASNGEEGLQKIQLQPPNIILLDIIMPVKDGFEVLEKLSVDKNLKKIPVIVFSTLGQKSDVQKALKLGAIDYVNKSFFNLDQLIDKILIVVKNIKS